MKSLTRFSLGCALVFSSVASAGPPFVTDDPEPVEPQHFEFNIAAQYARAPDGNSGAIPRAELNYGACKDMQTGITLPFVFDDPDHADAHGGLGDIELSIKYRFVQETADSPMVAFFPSVSLPTGDADRGLGAGEAAWFLPLWFQKSWDDDKWTSYGGGGFSINPAGDNFWRTGWLIQRELNENLTLGGELFFVTADAPDADDHLAFNLGGTYGFNDNTRLLFSAGRDLNGPDGFSGYFGIQLTW